MNASPLSLGLAHSPPLTSALGAVAVRADTLGVPDLGGDDRDDRSDIVSKGRPGSPGRPRLLPVCEAERAPDSPQVAVISTTATTAISEHTALVATASMWNSNAQPARNG